MDRASALHPARRSQTTIVPTVILTQAGMGIGHTALSIAGVSGIEATEQGLAAGLQGALGAAGGGLGLAIVTAYQNLNGE